MKKTSRSSKKNPVSFTIAMILVITIHDYLDPPWLGPTKKLKNGDSKIGLKTIKFKLFWKKIPWLFPGFWEILQKFPEFSSQ